MKKFGLPLVLVLVVGVLVGVFLLGSRTDKSTKNNTNLLGIKHADQGQKHIDLGEKHDAYNSSLPSSGPHYKQPTAWGVKDAEVADETLVHNEEHGGVVITYKPDLPKDQVDQLKQLFQNLAPSQQFNEVKAVLAPRAANDQAVQLGAWTYTLGLDTVDSAKINQFYTDHLDKGPELVP